MRYIPIIFFVLLFFLIAKSHAQARQDEERLPPLSKDRFYKGGGLGLFLGNPFTLQLYPSLGYKVTPRYSIGISGTYAYFRYKVDNGIGFQYNITSSIYGGSLFTRYFVTENIFLHGEYEILNMDVNFLCGGGTSENRVKVPAALLGGGYTSYISNKSAIYIMVLYDFIESNNCLQTNPRIVAGIGIGL